MRIEIVLDDGVTPVTGWVTGEGCEPVGFCGWLPLLGILERLTASEETAAQRLSGELGPGGDVDLSKDV